MDELNCLFFPRTNAQYALFRQLLIFFDTIDLYQAAEDFEADLSDLGQAGLLRQSAPVPFGDELDNFQRLVKSMVVQAGDAYAGYLHSLSNAAQMDVDEATVWNLIGGMKGQGREASGQAKQDELLKARLLMRLAEVHQRQEDEIAQALAGIELKNNLFLENLKGEDESLAKALAGVGEVPSEDRSRFKQRLKAWGHLFLADQDLAKHWLLLTDQEDALDQLCLKCQDSDEIGKILELPLPLFADHKNDQEYAGLRSQFHQQAQECLTTLRGYLSKAAQTGEMAEDELVQQAVKGWQESLNSCFPDSQGPSLEFYLFKNRSLASLFADLTGSQLMETGRPNGVIALIKAPSF